MLSIVAATALRPAGRRLAMMVGRAALSSGSEHSAAELAKSAEVVVFSKTTCGFCARTKGSLEALDVPFTAIELNELPNGAALQAELVALSGQRTVPNVFIKGAHLGGAQRESESPACQTSEPSPLS